MPIRESDMALGTNGDRCQTHIRTQTHTHTPAPSRCTTQTHTCSLSHPRAHTHTTRITHHTITHQTQVYTCTHTHTYDVRSICVREGLDVVAQCREQEKNPMKFGFIGNTDYTEIDYLDANKKQRVGNGRWCNSPVKCAFVSLYISASSSHQWKLSVCAFLHCNPPPWP